MPWRTGVAALARWLADERGLEAPVPRTMRPQAVEALS
jgi:hypothetical protein